KSAQPDGPLRRDVDLCEANLVGRGVGLFTHGELNQQDRTNDHDCFQCDGTKRGGISHSRNETSTQKHGSGYSGVRQVSVGRSNCVRCRAAVAEFSVTSRRAGSYWRAVRMAACFSETRNEIVEVTRRVAGATPQLSR